MPLRRHDKRTCTHCGHTWFKKNRGGAEPRRCPLCNTIRWRKLPNDNRKTKLVNPGAAAAARSLVSKMERQIQKEKARKQEIKENRKKRMREYHRNRRRDELGPELNFKIDNTMEMIRVSVSTHPLFYNRAGVIGDRWYRTDCKIIISKHSCRIYIRMDYGRNRKSVPLGGRLRPGEYSEGGIRSIDVKSLEIKSHGKKYSGPAETDFLNSLVQVAVNNLQRGYNG